MKVPIVDPRLRALIPPISPEELALLEASIVREGCRDPLVVWDGVLLDGHNRLDICIRHGIPFQTVAMAFKDRSEAMDWMDANQLGRRNLTPDQRSLLRGRSYNRTKKTPAQAGAMRGQAVDKMSQARTSEEIAAKHGVTERTIRRDGKRAEAFERLEISAPEKARAVLHGEKRFNEVHQELKREQRLAFAKELDAKPPAPPDGSFDVIICDPPWRYDSRAEDLTHRGRLPYPDMDVEQICKLPVPKLAEPNCLLWLWTTNAFMGQAYQVLNEWGFEGKTILTWVKDRMGVGNWLRGQTEHCILAVRGAPITTLTNQTTVLEGAIREHSRKPDSFFDLVNVLCHGRKLEMFAREARPGWQSWGGETSKF